MPVDTALTPPALSDAKRRLLAQRLKGRSASVRQADRIQPRAAGSRTPISPDQYRLWLHASMQPELPTYNEAVTVRYRGTLEPGLLEAAFNQFLARHEAWRTSFTLDGEDVLQVIHPEVHLNLQQIDLTHLLPEEREPEALRLATAQAATAIDMKAPPLLRGLLLRVAPDDHRLCLVLHHILFDGLSLRRTFLPELAALYDALASGTAHPLDPNVLQYADYAAWREQQVAGPSVQRQLDHWKNRLAGDLPILRLPCDRPRTPQPTQAGATERFEIPADLTEALRRFSNAHGVSLYMTLFAAFKAVLFRYSGQQDLIVGAAADGRRRPELNGVMGYILDTFAVRTTPAADLPFTTYLAHVKQSLLEAFSAAEVPFERVVQAVCTNRDASCHPIFQVFFSYLPPVDASPAGWEIMPIHVNAGAAKFDIYLEADEHPTHVSGRILYSRDLFEPATIQRLFGHWQTLLEGICHTPNCALGDLPLLTPAETHQLLHTWNDRAVPLPATTLHGLVEAQADRTPAAAAVQFEDTTWTYAQLDGEATRIAHHLRHAGAAPGQLAALCIDRSHHLPACLLAILKTGAAYLPLDPDTPRSRVMLCLEDAAPAVLLTHRALAAELTVTPATTVLHLEDLLAAEPLPPTAAPLTLTPEDPAYVIHTSGSTGRPKAVEISHGAAVNLLLSIQREPGFQSTDALLAVTTISFDIATMELFLPLIAGGRLVIAGRRTAVDPTALAALLRTSKCTVLQATPATWRGLLAIDWPGQPGLRALCGGEPLTRDLAEALLARKLDLWNLYGPTETTIWSTASRVQSGSGSVSIGHPISNTTAYILDARQHPVPIGVPGELYLGGAGVANGYRGRPDLTADKFVTLPVANNHRIYRTGDYAAFRPDGTIECQGRADNQVKVRGYRIELEEVELHLNAHPHVAVAAARVWPDNTGGNRLSAYFVAKGESPTPADLRDFLNSRLPKYMLPSDLIELPTLPLTSNGKLDRKSLPAPVPSAPTGNSSAVLTEEEQKLARIWAEILGIESVGPEDNFFDLGGHSILLISLFARVNREFHATLPITTIFDTPTLAGLATLLREKARLSALVPVHTAGTQPPLFMTYSYLLYQGLSRALGPDQPFYGLRELDEDLDRSIEERAIRYIAEMRRIQPHGPYHVAGWCAAAPMAIETARQLLRAGEKVGTLLLFDSWLPGGEPSPWSKARSIVKKFSKLPKGQRLAHVKAKLARNGKRAAEAWLTKYATRFNRLAERTGLPLPRIKEDASVKTLSLLNITHIDPLPARITLLRASHSPLFFDTSETCGWERVAEHGVEVLWAPGDHETMFLGDNLKITANLVRDCLSR